MRVLTMSCEVPLVKWYDSIIKYYDTSAKFLCYCVLNFHRKGYFILEILFKKQLKTDQLD